MSHYIKSRIWDFILCLVCQAGLVFSLLSGFELEDSIYEQTVLIIVFMAVLDILFFVFAYNRLMTFIGIGIGIAALAAYIFYAANSGIFSDEAAHSLGITMAVVVLVALGVFLLGRSRAGIAVLFVFGNIINAGAYFLQYPVKGWSILLFVFGCLFFFLYRNYMTTVRRVRTGKVKLPTFIIQAGIIVLAAFLLAVGAYEGIVKPLNPPTRELKLITKLEDMDIIKVLGVMTRREMYDPDKVSEEQLNSLLFVNELIEEGEPETQEEEEETTPSPEDPMNDLARDVSRYATSFVYFLFHDLGFIWIIAAVILVIAALFVIRYLRRRRWNERVCSLSTQEQVVNYYQYFLNGLSKLGFRKAGGQTLYEFSAAVEHEMEAFAASDVTFGELTDVYVKTWYGRHEVSEEEAGRFKEFYNAFLRNARKEVGTFRYCLKFFAL